MSEFDIRKALGQPDELIVYQNDVVLHRPLLFRSRKGKGTGNRRKIVMLTMKSLRALAFTASNTEADFKIMVTLTYPSTAPTDGKAVKRHLNAFLTALRRIRGNLGYLWFLEFQERGAPHFHILMSTKYLSHKWVAHIWNRIAGDGSKEHLEAGTEVKRLRSAEKARHYAVKYAMKPYQKIVPVEYDDVGRFWSCSKCVIPRIRRTVQVLGYDDVIAYLEKWSYRYIINHDSLVSVLYNATAFL